MSVRSVPGPSAALLFLRANARHLAELLLASLLINAFVLTLPLFSMMVYDKAVGNEIHDTLWALTLGIGLVFAFELCLRLARVVVVEHAGARWDMQLDERLLRGVLAAPVSCALPVGQVLARYREIGNTRDVLSAQFLLPVADVPFIVLFVAVLAAIGGPLVFIPLGMAVLLMGLAWVIQGVSQRRQRVANSAHSRKLTWLVDLLLARESLLTPAAAQVASAGFKPPSAEGARAAARARLWNQYGQQLMPIGLAVTTVATLVAGVYRIESQDISTGGLISSTMLGGRMVGSLCALVPLLLRWKEFMRALRELRDTVPLDSAALAAPALSGIAPQGDAAAGLLAGASAEGLRLEAVSCRYGTQERRVLNELTLQLRPGELVALVGGSGAGKTTLLRLLGGQLSHDSGRLACGGRVVATDAQRRWLAAGVAYKPQEPAFLGGSVVQIVAPGETEAGAVAASVLAALRQAGLGPALDRGELGLNTEVGTNGGGLSGGQRQMLALARSLYASTDVLLLDEPTLGLDRQAQETLLKALPGLKAGRCVVVATHTTEMIQICDRVLVLDQGRLVADAPPARLLAGHAGRAPVAPVVPATSMN